MSNIVDVDFRILSKLKQIEDPEYPAEGGVAVRIPVLQWRKNVLIDGFGGIQTHQWTEWQDVRTEEE